MMNAPHGMKHQKLTAQPAPPDRQPLALGLQPPVLDPEFLRHDPARLARDLVGYVLGAEFPPHDPVRPVHSPEFLRHALAGTVHGPEFLPRDLERQRQERRCAL